MVVEVRGEVGSRSSPFIGAGRSVWRGYFELRGAPMAGNGGSGKIQAWTPASGILGRSAAVRIDPSCRAAVAVEGRPSGSNGGRFGGYSSLPGLRLSEQWRSRCCCLL
jgi:hypothetical protein